MKHKNLIHGVVGLSLLLGAFVLGAACNWDGERKRTQTAVEAWRRAQYELALTQQTLREERRMQGYFCDCGPNEGLCSYEGYGDRATPNLPEGVNKRYRVHYSNGWSFQ